MKILMGGSGRREPRRAVRENVAEIIREVRLHGSAAVIQYTWNFDGPKLTPEQLQVTRDEIDAAPERLEPQVLAGIERSIANVRAVAEAQLREPVTVNLPEGHTVEVAELPVGTAGVYVPGGKAPYPSTVVMGALTARVAGVRRVVVCSPPARDGTTHPAILAACALCEVDEVYRMGGAQAIAALAHMTDVVPYDVDVIVGPGNIWVQEAKRQLMGIVGIDAFAGPSELVVLASPGADPELVALDLLAQAEHGPDGLVEVIATDAKLLDAIVAAVERLAPERPSVSDAELGALCVEDLEAALWRVELTAPEHLELVGEDAEALADRVRRAGCLFVGAGAGTAFGDYVAGSNHVLPTGGAARFQSALSPATFRRRMARVTLPAEAAAALAPAGAAVARAEGFPVHAESMERRA
jgi:histidinol dehydrogenase